MKIGWQAKLTRNLVLAGNLLTGIKEFSSFYFIKPQVCQKNLPNDHLSDHETSDPINCQTTGVK
jgi:hypothetical protein